MPEHHTSFSTNLELDQLGLFPCMVLWKYPRTGPTVTSHSIGTSGAIPTYEEPTSHVVISRT